MTNLFALPWESFTINAEDEELILPVEKEKLENAPGFSKNHWLSSSEHDWLVNVYKYDEVSPHWL